MNCIILMAPPAAGKGTIANLLEKKYGYVALSMGQLIRNTKFSDELSEKISYCFKERKLIDDNIVYEILLERLQKDDINNFILDGFPRNLKQLEVLNKLQEKINFKVTNVINLDISYEEALFRTLGRCNCPKCNITYNVNTKYNNPIDDKNCRICGSDLERRTDDNEESLKKGFDFYNKETLPLLNHFYNLTNVVKEIATNDIDSLFKKIEKKLIL